METDSWKEYGQAAVIDTLVESEGPDDGDTPEEEAQEQ